MFKPMDQVTTRSARPRASTSGERRARVKTMIVEKMEDPVAGEAADYVQDGAFKDGIEDLHRKSEQGP